MAVLEVIQEERLADDARDTGDLILHGFADFAGRYALISDIRGAGLWVGVELVRDHVPLSSPFSPLG